MPANALGVADLPRREFAPSATKLPEQQGRVRWSVGFAMSNRRGNASPSRGMGIDRRGRFQRGGLGTGCIADVPQRTMPAQAQMLEERLNLRPS